MADREADPRWGFATRALHVGQGPDPATGAVVQPIHLATTFRQSAVGVHRGFEYSRSANPTRNALEECLASLESARHCLTFASGLAATTTVSAPRSRAISATAPMSTRRSSGLVGDSSHTIRVRSVNAARSASGSRRSTESKRSP